MALTASGKPLTDNELVRLRAWIEQGASWPNALAGRAVVDHWAFRAVVRPSVPAVQNRAWVRNEIDHFILQRLEAKALSPSPPAERRTLLRRLKLDLLGLPPTPEEVDAFAADQRLDAYERRVEVFLAGVALHRRQVERAVDDDDVRRIEMIGEPRGGDEGAARRRAGFFGHDVLF